MSNVTVPGLDLRTLTDEELRYLWRAADDVAREALRAECNRRDRMERLAQGRKRIYDEWYEAARAQYEAADIECRGELVNDAPGWPEDRDDFALWTLPKETAYRFATREMTEWWDANGGRLSWDTYRKQRAADAREQKLAASENNGYGEAWGNEHEQGAGPGGAVVDGHDGAAVRHGSEGSAARTVRGAGPVRYAGHVRQPGRPAMTVTPITGTVVAARRASTPPASARTPAEPIDGAWLADLADAWHGKHCYLTDAARHSAVLWGMAQHFRTPDTHTMVWDKFAHLLYIATRPGSGKTTVMKVTGFLCAPYYFGIAANPTAPGLCYTIAHERAVVCIDEAHRIIGPKGTRKADVVTIMCASFEQDGTYLNGRGGKANRVPVYSPMMIAAKEDPFLTSAGEEISDVIERSHVIFMTKPPEGTRLAPVTAGTKAQGALIAQKMAQWAAQQMADTEKFGEAAATARAAAAEIGLTGRDADVWLAQFTVAALCSPGHLRAACDAALELRRNQPAPRDEDDDDPFAELEASLADGGRLGSWGMVAEQDAYEAEPDATEADDWDWQDEPAEDGGEAEAPLTPASPVSAAYDAFVILAGQQPRLLAGSAGEDMAKMVCQARAKEMLAGHPLAGRELEWMEGRGGWFAVAGEITFALAPARTVARAV